VRIVFLANSARCITMASAKPMTSSTATVTTVMIPVASRSL